MCANLWLKKLAVVVGALLGLPAASPSFAQDSIFEGLGDLPGGIRGSWASDVSADGSVVVGAGNFIFGPDLNGQEAFRWTSEGGMLGLGDLPGGASISQANGISVDAAVVVGRSTSTSGFEAFLWTQELGIVGLGDLPGGWFDSSAQAVSADGTVVVGMGNAEGGSEPFRWTPTDGMVGLGHLPGGGGDPFLSFATDVSADGSVVVGVDTVNEFGEVEAFRWTLSEGMRGLGQLPGGRFGSLGMGVSPDGSIVVGAADSSRGGEAFIWTEAEGMIGLGDLPGGEFLSIANAVSANGSVVVGRSVTSLGDEAFIWDAEHGMRNLREVLSDDYGADLTGWFLMMALGISDDGRTIVGVGFNARGEYEGWIARIPEAGAPRGDLNCDGAFDGADIEFFFLALVDPAAYEALVPDCDINNADMNGDGAVDGADIDPFYECLRVGCP